MKKLLFGLAISWLANSVWAQEQIAIVKVDQAWVRETPSAVTTTAAYMQLTNLLDKEVVLIGGRSSSCEAVEIHQTIFEQEMAKMVPIEKLPLPPHATVTLKPKGLHIMLINCQQSFKAGDMVKLTLLFNHDWLQELSLEVKKADDMVMSPFHHHSHSPKP
jgi:copper(I)-binding protein